MLHIFAIRLGGKSVCCVRCGQRPGARVRTFSADKHNSLGLTGGLLDAGALGDALIAHINDGYPESILDRYDEVRRGVFHDYINPISQANLRRLKDTDPDTVRETDPFFQSLVAADSSKSEKIRGNRQLRIPILEV